MTDKDYTPLYRHEDELVTLSIGKPNSDMGAFIAFDANVQFGFNESQYTDMLTPLLTCIAKEQVVDQFNFYKCESGEYRFQSYALMLLLSKQTGLALQQHAKHALDKIIQNSDID